MADVPGGGGEFKWSDEGWDATDEFRKNCQRDCDQSDEFRFTCVFFWGRETSKKSQNKLNNVEYTLLKCTTPQKVS